MRRAGHRSASDFILDRVHRCTANPGYRGCFPLLWSLSPQLQHLSPDWLRWYFKQAHLTHNDWFVLPPSGDLYSYPGQMQSHDQAQYVANTERDCWIMNTSASVEWEWYDTWEHAVTDYYPRYSRRGIVKSLIAVNVPYMFPVWLFKKGEFYHILDGSESPLVLFRPREWRGASSNTSNPNLYAPLFAKEINEYAQLSSITLMLSSSQPSFNLGVPRLLNQIDLQVPTRHRHCDIYHY